MNYQIPKNIAVIHIGKIGDVINASPVCIELKKNYPDSRLIFITAPEGKEAVNCIPGVDKVIVFDKNNKNKGLVNFLKFAISVKSAEKIDTAIILTETFRAAFLALLIGAKQRIGRNTDANGFILTHKDKMLPEDNHIHISELLMKILRPIGLYNSDYKLAFKFSDKDKKYIDDILTEMDYINHNLIGICPCSASRDKDWKPEETAKLINYINSNTDCKAVLVGDEVCKDFTQKIRELGVTDFLDLSCKTSIPQLGALISKFQRFISVDTGSAHIAYALEIPTIVLFFHNNYILWGSRNKEINTLIYNPDSISAERVFEAFKTPVCKI